MPSKNKKNKADTQKILVTLPKKLVKKLDKYAENQTMGKRSIAVWYILREFLDKKYPPKNPKPLKAD